MSTIDDFRSRVDGKVQDDSGKISSTERDNFIQEAVKIYSQDRPRELVIDLPGEGGYDYALPSDFALGFSVIRAVEYPAGQRVPVVLEAEDYCLYPTPSGTKLRFLAVTPQQGDTIRVLYTALHVVDEQGSTIPAQDEEAVVNLAASLYCRALASYYAQTSDSTLGADVVNYRTKAQEYTSLADRLFRLFQLHLGKKEGDISSAISRSHDWDTEFSWGRDFLFHKKRWR